MLLQHGQRRIQILSVMALPDHAGYVTVITGTVL